MHCLPLELLCPGGPYTTVSRGTFIRVGGSTSLVLTLITPSSYLLFSRYLSLNVRRSHRCIFEVSSRLFYGGALEECGDSAAVNSLTAFRPLPRGKAFPVLFIGTVRVSPHLLSPAFKSTVPARSVIKLNLPVLLLLLSSCCRGGVCRVRGAGGRCVRSLYGLHRRSICLFLLHQYHLPPILILPPPIPPRRCGRPAQPPGGLPVLLQPHGGTQKETKKKRNQRKTKKRKKCGRVQVPTLFSFASLFTFIFPFYCTLLCLLFFPLRSTYFLPSSIHLSIYSLSLLST